jgi:DNA-binding YbaB/EbfC family protein
MTQNDPLGTDPPDRAEDERSSDERGLDTEGLGAAGTDSGGLDLGGLELGGMDLGGMDLGGLLEQAQHMQEQIVATQHELENTEVTGTVGDGLVTVTVDGTGELRRVRIRKGSFDPDETEDLEDLIVAAYRDAHSRAMTMAAERMGPLTGLGGPGRSAGLPPGF